MIILLLSYLLTTSTVMFQIMAYGQATERSLQLMLVTLGALLVAGVFEKAREK
jgi:hypothetical protein